jgi:hypothetical protein
MRLLGLVILAAWLSAPAAHQVPPPPDEAEVYRVALQALEFESLGSRFKKHVLSASTFDPGGLWRGLDEETIRTAPYLHPRRRLTYARPETVESFLAAIDTQKPLPQELRRLPAFLVVDAGEARAITARNGWRDFERRNALAPGSVAVSRIGFDPSGSQALLYVNFVCGSLCGSGRFVLLERSGGTWRVVKIDGYMES